MDLEHSLLDIIRTKYPDVKEQYYAPLSSFFLRNNLIKGWDTLHAVQSPQLFIRELVYLPTYKLIQDLIKKGYDIWFVTLPNQDYHYQVAVDQKIAQISRLFGQQMVKKMIFTGKKYEVKGKYLIDDNMFYIKDMAKSIWKQILVTWRYNKDVDYDLRVELETIQDDVSKILGISE